MSHTHTHAGEHQSSETLQKVSQHKCLVVRGPTPVPVSSVRGGLFHRQRGEGWPRMVHAQSQCTSESGRARIGEATS
jgi:hypothetical protein